MENKFWFFVDEFMDFMRKEFPEPMSNHFTYNLLKNTINFLIEQTEYQSQLVDWIQNIVPEVTRQEIEYYCNK